ncbi:hypothetical protein DL767_009098 [Monosporascus sp. MG133]|nr:hypothetical protein DL767_009098 [Monosporascus sp. MG133]
MEEPHVFVNRDDPIPTIFLDGSRTPSRSVTPSQRRANHDSDHSDAEIPSRPKGLRGRFSALKGKANIQDHLVEKLLQQVIPVDGGHVQPEDERQGDGNNGGGRATTERPNFNITTMSVNFRRFNARIGVVFVFQERVERLLSWHQPTHTLSFLAIYTFVCLDPYLLPLLPLTVLLVAILIPSFAVRHPDPEMSLNSEQSLGGSAPYSYYSSPPRGPPLAPAVTVRPAKELSRDFFRNMRDLQNSMEDFSQLHDAVVSLVVPRTNFSDEALSSALFAALFAACLLLSIASAALPWRLIFLAAGWAATCAGHPAVARALESVHRKHLRPQLEHALSLVGRWAADDVILDGSPETREVEIFELQRLSPGGGEWEPWLFSASPYDPLSPARIAGEKPAGSRFFEDVLPPKGWEWSEKKWALDLWSREWVEERIITGVEIETEGERWVYDIYDENADRVGVVEDPAGESKGGKEKGGKGYVAGPSWEEGEDGDVKRGEWRRRRWVRLVKRKKISDS